MNNTKNNVVIKINPGKVPDDVIKNLLLHFQKERESFIAIRKMYKDLKNGKKKGIKNSLIKFEFVCINMNS